MQECLHPSATYSGRTLGGLVFYSTTKEEKKHKDPCYKRLWFIFRVHELDFLVLDVSLHE